MHLSRFVAFSGLALAGLSVFPIGAAPRLGDYGNVPMAFEPNRGQADGTVRFLSRGRGYTLLLRDRDAVLGLGTERVGFRWMGARTPSVKAENATGGVSNYLTAKFKSTNIPHYARVRQAGLYRGIDAVYYGTEKELEYDLIVRPGADPSQARFRVEGAQSVALRNGELHIALLDREIVHRRPIVFQTKNGVRQEIAAEYALLANNEVGFRIGEYDRNRELVIDPVISYTVARGGTGVDEATGIAVDTGGNAYVTGYTAAADFPTVAPGQATLSGPADAFVFKLNPAGNQIVYSTFLGGTNADLARGAAVDSLGSVYVVGETLSTDLPVFDPLRRTYKGFSDGFLIKLTPAGNQVVYGTYLGGGAEDRAMAVALDAARNAYVTGWTASTDFNEVGRADSSLDAFLVRVNTAGNAIVSQYRGGAGTDRGYAVRVDNNGNVYIGGETNSTNIAGAAFQTSKRGAAETFDGFIAKWDTNLTQIYWAYLGGDGNDVVRGIATDTTGAVYATGSVGSPANFPVVGGVATTGGGVSDAFVTKLNPLGTAIVYSTLVGGESDDFAFAIAVDGTGSAHVAGRTISSGFPRVGSVKTSGPGVTYDAFVVRLNAAGNALQYSTLLGGSRTDVANGLALDSAGAAYIAGFTLSNEIHGKATTEQDGFVMKLANTCSFTLNPSALALGAAPQTVTILVDAGSECAWNASAAGSFFSIVGPASGTGPGSVSVSIQANPGVARNGSMTIAGQNVPVTQRGSITQGCSYALSSAGTTVTAAGIESSVNFTTSAGCAWESYSTASWLQVFPLSGTTNATLHYTVFPNFTGVARNASIVAGGQTFTVAQAANTRTADERFVQLIYFSFLGRLPDAQELQFQSTTGLGPNKDYAGLVMTLFNSQEFNMGGRLVAGLYVGLLDRNAEFGGWQFQRNALTRGIVFPHSLVRNFLEGAEYGLRFGSPSNEDFVRLLYQYVLLRPASPEEVAFQASNLKPNGNLNREDLALNFLNSQEFRQGTGPRLTAFLLYATLLLRDASPSDMQGLIAQLAGADSAKIKQLVNQFIQGAEFRTVVGWQ